MNIQIYTAIYRALSKVLDEIPIIRYAISEFHVQVLERGTDYYKGEARVFVEYNAKQHTYTFAWMSNQFQISVESVEEVR